MKKMKKQLIELLNIHGVSRQETEVRSYLKPKLEKLLDKVWIDAYGNLLGEKQCGNGKGSTILLSAHMDTVEGVQKGKKVVEENGVIVAYNPDGNRGVLGADDRAGIAIVLTVLENIPKTFNGNIKVAFSREEEIGCRGADKITSYFYHGVDLAIVVDRRGNRDIVVGCDKAFCSNEVGVFMENVSAMIGFDYQCVEGGISDAYIFADEGINSINLSAGYMNEHTKKEYVNVEHMKDTARLIIQAIAVINTFVKTFTQVPAYNTWVAPYTYVTDVDTKDNILKLEGENGYGEVMMYEYIDYDEVIIEQDGNSVILTKEQLSIMMQCMFSFNK